MIDPISVCELEAGRPRYQVPRFQMIAAISSANTIANPAELPTCRINYTGRSDIMPNATVPLDSRTPRKIEGAGPNDGDLCRQRVRVDDRRHCVGRVVESIDELKAEGNEKRDEKQQ